jgi:hypothetical protein
MNEHKPAEPNPRECALPVSAAAAHRKKFSSANIPAVRFVITDLPSCCYQRNQANQLTAPFGDFCPAKSRSKNRCY